MEGFSRCGLCGMLHNHVGLIACQAKKKARRDAWMAGYRAFGFDGPNPPHPEGSEEYKAWMAGYMKMYHRYYD